MKKSWLLLLLAGAMIVGIGIFIMLERNTQDVQPSGHWLDQLEIKTDNPQKAGKNL